MAQKTLSIPAFVFAISLAACGSTPGTPVNYHAIISPKFGAVAFKDVGSLNAYTANDNAAGQADADTLENAYGDRIPQGQHVTVLSELPDDHLIAGNKSRDHKDCLVQDNNDRQYWIECMDALPTKNDRESVQDALDRYMNSD